MKHESLTAICLRTQRHSDSQSVLTVWDLNLGRLSLVIPAGGSRTATRLRALTIPLSVIEAEAAIRPNADLHRITDVRPHLTLMRAHSQPARIMVAAYTAQWLDAVLRHSAPDVQMSRFLIHAVDTLEHLSPQGVLNFIPYLMLRLTRFLGIEPDWGAGGTFFDLREGAFTDALPTHGHVLDALQTRHLRLLARMHPRNLHRFKHTLAQRRQIINCILQYYTLHHGPVPPLSL